MLFIKNKLFYSSMRIVSILMFSLLHSIHGHLFVTNFKKWLIKSKENKPENLDWSIQLTILN